MELNIALSSAVIEVKLWVAIIQNISLPILWFRRIIIIFCAIVLKHQNCPTPDWSCTSDQLHQQQLYKVCALWLIDEIRGMQQKVVGGKIARNPKNSCFVETVYSKFLLKNFIFRIILNALLIAQLSIISITAL